MMLLTKQKLNRYILALTLYVTFIHYTTNDAADLLHIVQDGFETQHYSLHYPRLQQQDLDTKTSPTLAHLNHTYANKHILDSDDLQQTLQKCDIPTIEKIINTVTAKEKEYTAKDYIVFYHGQRREFLLMQDLLAGLFKLIYKKAINNFVYLRIPKNNFNTYHTVSQFLGKFQDSVNDLYEPARSLLLSVNPWLFGNINNYGSSSFTFFLSSSNLGSINFNNISQKIFDFFKLKTYFHKYNAQLRYLNKLLSSPEPGKTGLLLQIFIPKKFVNTITYRSHILGVPYFGHHETALSPSRELTAIKQSFNSDIDDTQYRILLDKKLMLNPNSGIKIFRYYNEDTPNMKVYRAKLKSLFASLSQVVKNITT